MTTTPVTTTPLAPLQGLALEPIADGLATPVFVTSPPGDDRLFVVEKPGTIRIVGEDAPFLDITGLTDEANQEQGL
ncbi:MAG: PQQ-dependent sugar dehydrogenase, partial [Acidimicrobiia bacterium]|nr:PQQ-dependent sugar dehydrogenase [Acidimicrobiia bacterium]